MECPICVDRCNVSNIVTCPSCEHKACKRCYKTYILNSERDAITCMNCNIMFNRSTILSLFGKNFLTKTFLDHQKEVQFKQNQTMFPDVLPIVENELECRKLKNKIQTLENEIFDILSPFRRQIQEIEEKMQDAISHLEIQKKNLTKNYDELKNNANNHRTNNNKIINNYTRPCLNQECKGYLNDQYKCGLCKTAFCQDCYEQIHTGVEHECDPNLIENVKLMKKDTKNCPSCGTGIYKIDGCNQMFCTTCHTAFNWKTGLVDKGVIHNPHYYEYLRETRDVMPTIDQIAEEAAAAGGENNVCFDRPRIINIFRGCIYKHNKTGFNRYTNCMIDLVRIPDHIDDIIIELNRNIDASYDNQRNNRIKFLLDDITRQQFDTEISKDIKKIQLNQEIILLIETIRDVSRDSIIRTSEEIREMFRSDISEEELKNVIHMMFGCIKEIQGIFTYGNNAFQNLRNCYQSKRTFVLDGFLEKILEKHKTVINEMTSD